ncbi:hypothetical protein V3C99_000457 [Haemonchus contortus]
MFGFLGSRGRSKSKGISSSDISLPYDFRIETHIEPGSSVRDVIIYANHNTTPSHQWRPNLLTPNPDWPTVGARQRISREPLTEEELRKSPFGKYLKDVQRVKGPQTDSTWDSGRPDMSSMNSSSGTIPSSPIPRAPTRYRDRIPSPWMNHARDRETHGALHRINSKSLPQITKPLCEFRGCDSCEVCKKGTVTSRIYFPATALNSRTAGSQQNVKADRDEDEEYDEIISRNNSRFTPQVTSTMAPATIPRSTRENAPTKLLDQKRLAPSPPPRGIPVRKPPKKENLDFSPVTMVSSVMPPELSESSSESSSTDSTVISFEVKPHVELVNRTSMDSGVGDDEEPKVTRL